MFTYAVEKIAPLALVLTWGVVFKTLLANGTRALDNGSAPSGSSLRSHTTIDLIHDTRHLCTGLKTDRMQAMSRGF